MLSFNFCAPSFYRLFGFSSFILHAGTLGGSRCGYHSSTSLPGVTIGGAVANKAGFPVFVCVSPCFFSLFFLFLLLIVASFPPLLSVFSFLFSLSKRPLFPLFLFLRLVFFFILLCCAPAQVCLQPGEKRTVEFAVGWDMPVGRFGSGRGHYRRYTKFYGKEGNL